MSASLVGSEMCIRDRVKAMQRRLRQCARRATVADSTCRQEWVHSMEAHSEPLATTSRLAPCRGRERSGRANASSSVGMVPVAGWL
eukprot:4012068-Alexandrium_andersonii.AAC.1